uniref:Uncharacterized protein n=1 Tax=viral metagenome TaxID=1070528 RepID=A0A6C0C324_9ZZZZ
MSWATAYSGSNNIHFEQPAIMSDSRLFTYYNSSCDSNESLKKNKGIESNYDYRQYLIKHGNSIIEQNKNKHINSIGYVPAYNISNANRNNKYLYKNIGDNTQTYGYATSDLKNMYLSRQQLQSKKTDKILTQEELLKLRSI